MLLTVIAVPGCTVRLLYHSNALVQISPAEQRAGPGESWGRNEASPPVTRKRVTGAAQPFVAVTLLADRF